ncbi:MAG: transposase, partial [Cyanobacteriota bacterium]
CWQKSSTQQKRSSRLSIGRVSVAWNFTLSAYLLVLSLSRTHVVLLSEVGLDPTRFPTVKHFTSWLGLCPGSRVTGGKVKSSQTRKVTNRAATAFRMAAQTLCRSHSALGAYYRRMQARMGAPKAITASAHKLARIFYRLWTSGDCYIDAGFDAYELQYRERMLKNLKKKAQALGLELVPLSTPAECVS